MNRIVSMAAFTAIACAGMATPLYAGAFGLFYCGRYCGSCGGCCVRPYNAFSSPCCGLPRCSQYHQANVASRNTGSS